MRFMIRKIIILIVLISCSFNLRSQSDDLEYYIFDRQLPVRIEHDNIELYFRLLMDTNPYSIPEGVPVFMPKNITNLTIYCWDTCSEFGKMVKTRVRETYDATYKEGKLRTLRKRGDNHIKQYEFYDNLPIRWVEYRMGDGSTYDSGKPLYFYDKFASKSGVYIRERNFFDVNSNVIEGFYYNIDISTHSTYVKVVSARWQCSKSYFLRKFGGISMYKVCKNGFSSLVNYRYSQGYSDCVKDKSIRIGGIGVGTSYINAIGLHTDIDAFECIRNGWKGNRYYYTYDYE